MGYFRQCKRMFLFGATIPLTITNNRYFPNAELQVPFENITEMSSRNKSITFPNRDSTYNRSSFEAHIWKIYQKPIALFTTTSNVASILLIPLIIYFSK